MNLEERIEKKYLKKDKRKMKKMKVNGKNVFNLRKIIIKSLNNYD